MNARRVPQLTVSLPVLCALAFGLTGCGAVPPVRPSEIPEERAGTGSLPVLGSCNLSPNYATSANPSRWAGLSTGLAISVSINVNRNLPNLSAVAADNYIDGARFGLGMWQPAMSRLTGWRLPDLQISMNNAAAPIQLTLTDAVDSSAATAQGVTRFVYASANGRTVIVGADITLQRPNLKGAEVLLANGVWSQWMFNSYVANIVAHELGHALGIRGHSPNRGDLMAAGGNRGNGETDSANWITQADANTLSEAYCR